MTRARQQLISCADTPYYHCIARCVRRAFLCGFDQYSNTSFEHRQQWVIDRLALLDQVFCIDICAYAIMSNHYHLVLFINKDLACEISDLEVIERWLLLFKGPDLIQRFVAGEELGKEHLCLIAEIVDKWRARLQNISWLMRTLNEHIARLSNFEDNCKGRFWEGRFKSQALLDEHALLTCMAYVELNPIRANMAATPEESEYTSIKQRIDDEAVVINDEGANDYDKQKIQLKEFLTKGDILQAQIPFHYTDYLSLVDWSGRAIRPDKRGAIDATLPAILIRLNIDEENWIKAMQPKGNHSFSRAMGCCDQLRAYAKKLEIGWIKGVGTSLRLFPH